MKYVTFLLDGVADYSIDELGGKTPLEYASTPNLDRLAQNAVFGTFLSLPDSHPTSSDVANMSVLGWDLDKCYTGRGAIESFGAGYEMAEDAIAFRLNLITTKDDILEDYSAGHLSNEEGEILIRDLNDKFGSREIEFKKGVGYRNILFLNGSKFSGKIEYAKPDSSHGQKWREILPKSKSPDADFTKDVLRELILKSREYLVHHPVNIKRVQKGKNPANLIWPWSGGQRPKFPSFFDLYKKRGSVVSAVDVILGLGRLGQMEVLKPEGATGFIDTNYENKAKAGLSFLEERDFVFIHLEAIDECGHMGDLKKKIEAIENADLRLIGAFLSEYNNKFRDEIRYLVLPDHPVPVSLRAHTRDKVPFMISGGGIDPDKELKAYSEKTCLLGKYRDLEKRELMDLFFSPNQI